MAQPDPATLKKTKEIGSQGILFSLVLAENGDSLQKPTSEWTMPSPHSRSFALIPKLDGLSPGLKRSNCPRQLVGGRVQPSVLLLDLAGDCLSASYHAP